MRNLGHDSMRNFGHDSMRSTVWLLTPVVIPATFKPKLDYAVPKMPH